MRSINRIIAVAAIILSAGVFAHADNDTEFGVEDDLTVLGTGGSAADPDLEVKGFSVFGTTQSAPALQIPAAPGNIFVNGYVQVSSGMYVEGSSTFTAYAYFQSTVTMTEGNLRYGNGVSGKVLKSGGNGFVYWGDDNSGITSLNGTPYSIRMEDAAGTGLTDSVLMQNPGATNITVMGGSSMTVTGALGVGGLTTFDGNMTAAAYGIFQSTVQFTGNTGSLTNVYFNNGAANVGKVLKASGNGFLYWDTDASGIATLGNPYYIQMVNAAGTGLANSLFLQDATGTSITMVAGSSITVNELLAQGDFKTAGKLHAADAATFVSSVTALANTQFGNSVSDIHGVNMAPETGTGLAVNGSSNSGDYSAKFYSGGSLAAWIKKK